MNKHRISGLFAFLSVVALLGLSAAPAEEGGAGTIDAAMADIAAGVKRGEDGAVSRYLDLMSTLSWKDNPEAESDIPTGDERWAILYEVTKAALLVRDAQNYAGRALGNAEYDEEHYAALIEKLTETEPRYPAVDAEARRLIELAEADGARLREMRGETLALYQDELRKGKVNAGTRLAWSMIRLGVGMPDAILRPDSLQFSEDEAVLDFMHGDISVRIAMDKNDLGKRIRATVDGFAFTAGWSILLQKPLSWMLVLAESMREAGVRPETHPDWTVMEAPEGLIALRNAGDEPGLSGKVPEQAFFRGRLLEVRGQPVPADASAFNRRFAEAAQTLHEGIMGDERISHSLRQALRPVLEGTYLPVDPRDYFDSDFCRRLIEADYLESHIKPLPPERAEELAAYREALAKLEAGYDRFTVDVDAETRLVAVAQTDLADDEDGVRLDAESGEAVPQYEWRLEESDATTFYSALPERYLYALSLAERYDGRHRLRPEGAPAATEVWHAVLGRIGGYRDGEASAFGSEEAWLEAVTLDCRGRLDTTSGPLGWNFPFHVLQRDGEGDPMRIATLRGVVESPDFSGISDLDARRRDEDAWLDHAVATLREPGELGLIYHHFFRYTSDSPLPELPNLIGSHYGLSDTHQTVYQSLERRWVGRLIGDCDDLAEFFQVLTERQGKLSHVMQVPAHAAAGYVERTDDGAYRFVVLQTGPVLQFTAPTLYGAVEAAYRSFDGDRGNSRITAAAVPLLLRFADEDTRTPFVLSARIYEDREYAETMIRVQGYWHLNVFSSAIDEMKELVANDREVGNLKELASLYEQVGRYDESETLRREELEAADNDAPAALSTLLDIAHLHLKDKNETRALWALTQMEERLRRLYDEGDPAFDRVLPFRSACAVMLARLGEPVRAWELMNLDVAEYIDGGTRPPEYLVRTLVSIYDRMAMKKDDGDAALREAKNRLEKILDASLGRGYFRKDDSYNRILSKYYMLGRYALAVEGRKEGLRLLTWDGPYPEGPREHDLRRRPLAGADWGWLRINPDLYLAVGLEMLDQDDMPELYDPEGAKPVLEGVARAILKGRGLGADMAGGESLTKSRLVLSFLDNDLAAYTGIMTEVREKNYASLYDDAAVAFGNYCGLVPADEFRAWVDAFHRFLPGRQHYFKAAYRALDKEYFDHAIMLAKATAEFFPDDPLLVKEAEYLIEAVRQVRERLERKRDMETEQGREQEFAAPDGTKDSDAASAASAG